VKKVNRKCRRLRNKFRKRLKLYKQLIEEQAASTASINNASSIEAPVTGLINIIVQINEGNANALSNSNSNTLNSTNALSPENQKPKQNEQLSEEKIERITNAISDALANQLNWDEIPTVNVRQQHEFADLTKNDRFNWRTLPFENPAEQRK
jgi:outer membrane protein assembly factor BamA